MEEHATNSEQDPQVDGDDSPDEGLDTVIPQHEEEPRYFCVPLTFDETDNVETPPPVYLSEYIRRASNSPRTRTELSEPIFLQSDEWFTEPTLRRNRPNRIIVFAGCFNPPHLGHLELLVHIYLRADSETIAAMMMPISDVLQEKNGDELRGEAFQMTKCERMELLEDPVLRRFCWMYRGRSRDVEDFQREVVRCAAEDGYQIEFVSLVGSDHISDDERPSGWGLHGLMTSDITRPSMLLSRGRVSPRLIYGCWPWRSLLPADSIKKKGTKHCWPCHKFQELCPELAGRPLAASE